MAVNIFTFSAMDQFYHNYGKSARQSENRKKKPARHTFLIHISKRTWILEKTVNIYHLLELNIRFIMLFSLLCVRFSACICVCCEELLQYLDYLPWMLKSTDYQFLSSYSTRLCKNMYNKSDSFCVSRALKKWLKPNNVASISWFEIVWQQQQQQHRRK